MAFGGYCTSLHELRSTTTKLLDYCQASNWAGHDPYDALNSRLFEAWPILNSRIPRLVLTQGLKRSPVDIRNLLLIPKTQNPKAIALFLSAVLDLSKNEFTLDPNLSTELIDLLIALRSGGFPQWCWGYSFPWQTRTVIVPARAPNLVCTAFVAGALLNAYDEFRDEKYLAMATSAAEYILSLYWFDGAACGFSYPCPELHSQTHNATLLAAALFCRVYKHTGLEKFIEPALTASRYAAGKQRGNGFWYYGEGTSQHWIDNFHTGYNLSALRQIDAYLDTDEFEERVRLGFQFYKSHFVREDGAAKYFHDRTYPIDIHCVAQTILTLCEFQHLDSGNLELACAVFRWAMKHMWDEKGFFYYRVLRTCTIRTSYMRWSQAWMLLALATLLKELEREHKSSNPLVLAGGAKVC